MFNCPSCDALNQIVETQAGPETDIDCDITAHAEDRSPAAKEISFSSIFCCGKLPVLIRPGTRSSISPGRSCPSRAAIRRPWVTQCEDWY
jgi:hypothetical protein